MKSVSRRSCKMYLMSTVACINIAVSREYLACLAFVQVEISSGIQQFPMIMRGLPNNSASLGFGLWAKMLWGQ